MEKRECRVGNCDVRVEDIEQIKDALQKGLQKEGQCSAGASRAGRNYMQLPTGKRLT